MSASLSHRLLISIETSQSFMDRLLTLEVKRVASYLRAKNVLFAAGAYVGLQAVLFAFSIIRRRWTPIRRLPGPPNPSFLFGNYHEIHGAPIGFTQEQWMKVYGHTFVFNEILGALRVFTADPKALSFIMNQSSKFVRPELVRKIFSDHLGEGLLAVEFDVHKRQRRLMNPSFGPAQVRALVPIFWNKSNELRDIWLDLLKESPKGAAVINVMHWLSRATLDMIGVAGFDYHFNALKSDDEDELAKAFAKVFQGGKGISVYHFIKARIPGGNLLPNAREKMLLQNKAIMNRIGQRIVAEKKAALTQDLKTGSTAQGRDLLTLCIKSNMLSEDEEHRMSDDEVLAQIATFLVAGHETTATSTTWALYALAKNKKSQTKLRQELLDAGLGDEPGMAELDKLPYLDAVVRETMRIHPAVAGSIRQATENAKIPVSKVFKDRDGVDRSEIRVKKGDILFIPIAIMNRDREIWGEDAMEFRPERWEFVPEGAKELPGVWSHLMSFLSGPHACIGFRFAIIEMKALLYSLVRAIEFDIDSTLEVDAQSES
ncbi:cytochrome P450 family protein [Ceratobasidium sp. AG-Ba]|nr:cytochrome P450 family protein [Ceratobasidium sp. AG-Ba]